MQKSKQIQLALALILFTLIGVGLSSCIKSRNTITNTMKGVVSDEYGVPVSGATVTADTKTTVTDIDGNFKFTGLSGATTYRIAVAATGYFTGYMNAENIDGSEITTTIMLLARQNIGTLNASVGGQVQGPGTRYVCAPGAFKRADGSVYNGTVNVYSRYISADQTDMIARTMPGGDFRATDAAGAEGAMISLGYFATEFADAGGNVLKPATGQVTAAITIPASVPNPSTNNAQAWAYNPGSGRWTGSGSMSQIGSECFMPVTTLSYHNLDMYRGRATLLGSVTDCNGSPQAGVEVVVSNNAVKYVTHTNGNGKYKVTVAADLSYTVTANGRSVSTGLIQSGSTYNVTTISGQCPGQAGTGTFVFDGASYSGISVCNTGATGTGVNESFITVSGTAENCILVNPISSGSGSLTSAYYTSQCTTCPGLQVSVGSGSGFSTYIATSGTVSVSGSTIQITATMINSTDVTMTNPATHTLSATINCR